MSNMSPIPAILPLKRSECVISEVVKNLIIPDALKDHAVEFEIKIRDCNFAIVTFIFPNYTENYALLKDRNSNIYIIGDLIEKI